MELDKYEELLKNKNTVKFQITFFFIFFLLAVFAVFIITSVLQVRTVTHFVCSRLALPTVKRALTVINPEAFDRLAKSLDKQDPYYETTRRQLLAIKEESKVLYLYTMAPAEENLYRYIIDGSTIPGDSENFSDLGQTEDISTWDAAIQEMIRTKTTGIGNLSKTDKWGFTVSAYEPILKSSGELAGFVGCDIDASEIVTWVRTQIIWQLGIVAVLVIVGLTAYIFLIRRIDRIFGRSFT
ncbi:MAG: hypothetical protein LBO65_07820 [Spirochaetaceae bacterium]|jgi:sensor histidine kinase regulating citrate/malate metabolism|nr:hypothetical protein [Spirochaetaceae bacterium]